MSNILEIAQEAADICAAQRPTDLFDTSNQNDFIMASVVKSTLSSLMRHADWQGITRDAVLYTVDGQTEYLIDNIVPDFHSLVNSTIYIKDTFENVVGAITYERWAIEKQFHVPEIDLLFKIQNNKFIFAKNPGCRRVYFTYRSNAVCYDAQTEEPKSQITKNTDIPVFDNYLVKLGIVWRWNKRTGMDYTEEFNEYQRELDKSFAATTAAGDINLAFSDNIFDDPNGGAIVNGVKSCQSCCQE